MPLHLPAPIELYFTRCERYYRCERSRHLPLTNAPVDDATVCDEGKSDAGRVPVN